VNNYHTLHVDSDGFPYTESYGFLTLPADECAMGDVPALGVAHLTDPQECQPMPQNLWTGDELSVEIQKDGDGVKLGSFTLTVDWH
jgi:hypothetical protein